MFKKLQDFINQLGSSENDESSDGYAAIRIVSAALMIEVARADHHVDPVELESILKILKNEYQLMEGVVEALMDLTGLQADAASSLSELANHADKQLHYEAKIRLLKCLCRVAFVENIKDKYEEYVICKIADLLHVSHKDFIQARLAV